MSLSIVVRWGVSRFFLLSFIMVGLDTDDMLKPIDFLYEDEGSGIEDLLATVASRDGNAIWIPISGNHLANVLAKLPVFPGMSLVEVGPVAKSNGQEPTYVARAVCNGSIIPAYCGFHLPGARAIVDNSVVAVKQYEVLISKPGEYRWLKALEGNMSTALCGGIRPSPEGHLESLRIYRWRGDDGGWICGTIGADEAPPRYAQRVDSNWVDAPEVLLRDDVGTSIPPTSSTDLTGTPKAAVNVGAYLTDNHWTHVLPAGHYSSAVHFLEPLPTVPRVIVGLSKLDMGHRAGAAALRVRSWPQNVTKEGFICNAQAWSDTTLYNASVEWAAIEERHWQCGVFRTTDLREPWMDPGSLFDHRITFPTPFASPPMVLVCFSSFDLSGNWDLRTYATSVDHTGFNLSIMQTHGGDIPSSLWAASITWLALPGEGVLKRKNAWIGQFSTAGRGDMRQSGSCHGHVDFGIKFERPPKIFLGLNHFHLCNTANLRLHTETSNVTESGMDWNIWKWDDTILNGASAMYLAVDAD